MARQEQIIEEILKTIEDRIDAFNSRMPKVQQDAYAAILELSGDLDTQNGRIKPTIKNVKLIAKIKAELNKVIFDDNYSKELDKVVKTYDQITKLQNEYFTNAVGKFTVPGVLKEVQNLAIEGIVDSLGKEAIGVNVISPVRDILVQNVTTGGSKAEFIEQVRDYIIGNDKVDGKLVKYTKQIVTDSLNQYSASYNQIITDDLGFEFYRYVGSNKDTTRPFCKALTAAKNDCLPYIHKSQIPSIIEGDICGKQVPIYDKTGLPHGMIPGTNSANFYVNRGGYNCNHQLLGVPNALVPKALRDQFKGA